MFLQIQFSPQVETMRYSIAYIALFLVIFAGIIVFFTNFFVKHLETKKKKNLLNPNRKTTRRDISTIAQSLNLTSEEKNFLWELCQKNSIKNLCVELKDENLIDSIFKKEFSLVKNDEKLTTLLFSVRNKIDFQKNSSMVLNSSRIIPANIEMTLIVNENRYKTTLIENTKEGLILSAPKDISGNDIDIPALSKINLVFSLTNHVAYDMTSRLIRYQTRVIKEIITSHSTNISILHRRNFSRLSFDTKCIFSAVQVITDDAKKDNVIEYKPLEKKHIGKLTDISAEGCCLETELPIKPNQYIYIELDLYPNEKATLIGKIVASEINKRNNLHILHIKFVKIDAKTKNKIFSLVYDYI